MYLDMNINTCMSIPEYLSEYLLLVIKRKKFLLNTYLLTLYMFYITWNCYVFHVKKRLRTVWVNYACGVAHFGTCHMPILKETLLWYHLKFWLLFWLHPVKIPKCTKVFICSSRIAHHGVNIIIQHGSDKEMTFTGPDRCLPASLWVSHEPNRA